MITTPSLDTVNTGSSECSAQRESKYRVLSVMEKYITYLIESPPASASTATKWFARALKVTILVFPLFALLTLIFGLIFTVTHRHSETNLLIAELPDLTLKQGQVLEKPGHGQKTDPIILLPSANDTAQLGQTEQVQPKKNVAEEIKSLGKMTPLATPSVLISPEQSVPGPTPAPAILKSPSCAETPPASGEETDASSNQVMTQEGEVLDAPIKLAEPLRTTTSEPVLSDCDETLSCVQFLFQSDSLSEQPVEEQPTLAALSTDVEPLTEKVEQSPADRNTASSSNKVRGYSKLNSRQLAKLPFGQFFAICRWLLMGI